MRLSALVVLLLAPAAAAQSQFASGSGPYLTVDAVDPIRAGDDTVELGVGAGWRFANGFDAGLRVGAEHTRFDDPGRTLSETRRLAFGVETGYTARLATRTGLRLGFVGALEQTVEVGASTSYREPGGAVAVIDRGNSDLNAGGVVLSADAFRRIPLGRVTLQPTVGAFFGGSTTARADADRPFTLRADSGGSKRAEGSGGVAVGLPMLVEALGTDLALDMRGAYDVVRNEPDVSLRLRVNL